MGRRGSVIRPRREVQVAEHQSNCELCQRIEHCRAGMYPALIMEMDTGFAVLGESQFFLGYSLLICKHPVTELDELPQDVCRAYLGEMAQLAAAVRTVTRPHKLNYEALGNIVPHMHWHIFPRRPSDPAPEKPVWVQMPSEAEAERHRFDPARHGAILDAIRAELLRLRAW
jgi:diadenosine tetraphosphate (Ap4A) HIT family hydrolase